MQASYKKMLEDEDVPPSKAQTKQSIFSPSKVKQVQTPVKKGAYKTPTKTEIENQKYLTRFKL